jgi:hypothetical protein
MSLELWINNRRGFDISVPRFVVDETAIVKQADWTMQIFRQRHPHGSFVDIGFGQDLQRRMRSGRLSEIFDAAGVNGSQGFPALQADYQTSEIVEHPAHNSSLTFGYFPVWQFGQVTPQG